MPKCIALHILQVEGEVVASHCKRACEGQLLSCPSSAQDEAKWYT